MHGKINSSMCKEKNTDMRDGEGSGLSGREPANQTQLVRAGARGHQGHKGTGNII